MYLNVADIIMHAVGLLCFGGLNLTEHEASYLRSNFRFHHWHLGTVFLAKILHLRTPFGFDSTYVTIE
jgi:hypothetical protein